MDNIVMEQDYKILHEQFVSNHNGTWLGEIVAISTSIPFSTLLLGFCQITLSLSSWRSLGLEYFILIFPVLFSLTCCSDQLSYIAIIAVLALLCLLFFLHIKSKAKRYYNREALMNLKLAKPQYFPFLTNYRSSMLLTTAICILAVDFPVFPRRFAKTETFGFGLMDIGVGSFTFAGGLVSQEARKGKGQRSALDIVKKSWLEALPILLLGFLRLASVKASGYHEHVTEYGVHWNFFFTLAFTKIFSSVFVALIPVDKSWLCSLLIGLMHEGVLSLHVAAWIVSTDVPRSSFLSSNREGILSLPGYVAIYMAGVATGNAMRKFEQNSFRDNMYLLKNLVILTIVMYGSLTYSQKDLFLPPSRRLANWNYFNWMIAYNLFLLSLFLASDLILVFSAHIQSREATSSSSMRHQSKGKTRKPLPNVNSDKVEKEVDRVPIPFIRARNPKSFIAISYNGLAYFMLANILNALVNLSIKTIHVSSCPAVILLIVYAVLSSWAANALYQRRISLKFW